MLFRSYLLDEVRIHSDNKEVKPSNLSIYLRQNPNSKWFSLIKTQLYVYNWSGRDSARWINRTLRKMGDAPVIYSEEPLRAWNDLSVPRTMRRKNGMSWRPGRSNR